jgi:transcriptional regulator of acetoin/glycerol metabolism
MQTDCHADLALDIAIALRTSLPVLISGTPDDTMRVALVIASSNGNGHRGPLVVAAAADARFISSTLDAVATRHHTRRIVLLRQIEGLDDRQQEWLIETILTRCRTAAPPDWRLITTTSTPLAKQVAAGAFSPRLFYLLNAIHIVM